ncbi:MAG: phosphatidate cytidylyltransferase [Elusimicrobiota bacterium]|jgi:phosphatidate cytidylyltransferase
MLLPRVLTSLVGIPAVLFLVYLGGLPFLAFVLALTVLSSREYVLMLWAGGRGIQRWNTVLGALLLACAVAFSGPVLSRSQAPGGGLSSLALSLVFAGIFLREVLRREHSLDRAALSMMGVLFIGWPLGHLSLLRELPGAGRAWTLLLFAAVWAADSAAYFVGSAFGRRRMAPVLSPKKSWEGALAGTAAAVLTLWLGGRGMIGAGPAACLGLITGVVSQLSDVAQSMVKRSCGVKDSSGLLPGHGGVFDRMDSFLLLSPVFYYFVVLLGKNS